MLPGNERKDVEKGGKIIMPPSALDHLTRLNISYPMLFKLTNVKTNRITHCGVLEFVADEGKVYLPYWYVLHFSIMVMMIPADHLHEPDDCFINF
jgi:ubiquitin fusion degradation protein 1